MIHLKKVEHQEDLQQQHRQLQQLLHHRYRQMFPTPLQRVNLIQVISLKLTQLTQVWGKRLDRVTLLLIITILVVAGLRDQVGVEDRQVAVDMEEDTK